MHAGQFNLNLFSRNQSFPWCICHGVYMYIIHKQVYAEQIYHEELCDTCFCATWTGLQPDNHSINFRYH